MDLRATCARSPELVLVVHLDGGTVVINVRFGFAAHVNGGERAEHQNHCEVSHDRLQ